MNPVSASYGVCYTVTHFEEAVGKHLPTEQSRLAVRRLMAERELNEQLAELSEHEKRPHQIELGEWHSYKTERETIYQRKGRLVFF